MRYFFCRLSFLFRPFVVRGQDADADADAVDGVCRYISVSLVAAIFSSRLVSRCISKGTQMAQAASNIAQDLTKLSVRL